MRMEFNNYRVMHVHLDTLDLCKQCEYIGKCPLIRTLSDDLAVLRYESVRIDNCKMYTKKKKRA